ncbi:hypothetical protein [Proteus penneri]|uniref:hypothetical protein n=1 Tax=Proteus penneri TaxID=102862 RepID=UPI0015859A7E|nr:hypothetical protein [Proteus penneri]
MSYYNLELENTDMHQDEDDYYHWNLNDVSKTIFAQPEKLTLEMNNNGQENQAIFFYDE